MMLSKKTLNTVLAGAVAISVAGASITARAESNEKEKCYGVAKAGKNDCAAANGAHSCAGSSTTNGGGDEWIAVPKGLCERLVNGALSPVSLTASAPAPGSVESTPEVMHDAPAEGQQ